jgi:hypothetical protein
MSTILTFTLPTDGVPDRLLRDMEALLRVEYADHPGMRYSKQRRVWEFDIRPAQACKYDPDCAGQSRFCEEP